MRATLAAQGRRGSEEPVVCVALYPPTPPTRFPGFVFGREVTQFDVDRLALSPSRSGKMESKHDDIPRCSLPHSLPGEGLIQADDQVALVPVGLMADETDHGAVDMVTASQPRGDVVPARQSDSTTGYGPIHEGSMPSTRGV